MSYYVIVPAMLFTKVGQTVAGASDPWLLAIPLAAGAQVLIATALGRWAACLAVGGDDGGNNSSSSGDGGGGLLQIGGRRQMGWHPRNPAKSAEAIARTTAAATGVPQAAGALRSAPSRRAANDDGEGRSRPGTRVACSSLLDHANEDAAFLPHTPLGISRPHPTARITHSTRLLPPNPSRRRRAGDRRLRLLQQPDATDGAGRQPAAWACRRRWGLVGGRNRRAGLHRAHPGGVVRCFRAFHFVMRSSSRWGVSTCTRVNLPCFDNQQPTNW